MNPNDALQILDDASAVYAGSRQDHLSIQTALNTLRDFISQHNEAKSEPPQLENSVTPATSDPTADPKGDKRGSATDISNLEN
jgi:hypothetical protein